MSTTMADPQRIVAVRAFNRFYTSRLGMVRNGLHRTEHPLGEARVLYETGRGITDVSELKRALEIDPGQLSRLLTRLEAGGLITRERSDGARPRRRLRLTPAGAQAFHTLDHRAAHEVDELLDELPEDGQRALVQAMQAIGEVLSERPPPTTIRGPRPGDLGWLVERHGALYAEEYGWDSSFERLVAGIVARFDPTRDAAWIAEAGGAR